MRKITIQALSIGLFLTLLGWGIWTLLYYIGVPRHAAVLLPEAAKTMVSELCKPAEVICTGLHGFFPFIGHTLTKERVFVLYAGICLVLFLFAVLWNFLRKRTWTLQWSMTPWKLYGLFVFFVWLLFTCMTTAQDGQVPFRTIIQPVGDVYRGVGPEALGALKRNYASLKERGCLEKVGIFGNVAEASEISMFCLQQNFVVRVLPPLILATVFLLQLLIAGRFALRKLLRVPVEKPLIELGLSFGMGTAVWIVLLWLGAVAHIYTSIFGWLLVLLIPAIGFRDTQYWVEKFLHARWPVNVKPYSVLLLLTWFLLSFMAFNYINVVRPFPIGWDDLGSYLNRPRLLVSYGFFVHSMASFQWEYLTSLGFLLFGFDSTFGATSALMINWTEGFLAILAVYLFGRSFMGAGKGVLAATIYYTLPLVGHFSFADMKIDNAVFAMGALATFCVFYAYLGEEHEQLNKRKWILLAGIFAGLAFSMKVTAIMVFFALASVLVGLALHWTAFPAAVLLACAVFTQKGLINIPRIAEIVQWSWENASPFIVMMMFAVPGVALMGVALSKNTSRIKEATIICALLVAGFSSMVFPWIAHNNILHGSYSRLEMKAPNKLTPFIAQFGDSPGLAKYDKKYVLPPELAVDIDHEHCKSSAGKEELDRYWGNHVGWGHYFLLPWRSVMNIDHMGYYVTTQPALLLFPVLLLLPFFWRKGGRWLRYMWAGTLFLVAQWVFFANGVPWYGIGVFLGLALCLEALVAKAPDVLTRWLASFFIGVGLISCLGMRYWQYDTQRNMFEYPLGKISAETLQERTIPYYDDITDVVMEIHRTQPDRPLLYRIGTFIPYFVPKNLEVIGITDHQLDFFNCLYQDRDNVKTMQRLRALGIGSVVFDTNTATIEKDPNGSLHKKVQMFADFINSPETEVQMIINDTNAGIIYFLLP